MPTMTPRRASSRAPLPPRVADDYRHRAGQYLRFSVEIDGRRRTRSYAISSSALRRDGHLT